MSAKRYVLLSVGVMCLFVAAPNAGGRSKPKGPDAYQQPFGYFDGSTVQYSSKFRKLAAAGLSQIARGDLEGGIATLIEASKVPLDMNFELWDEIAQAKCREGDYVAGLSLLKEYRCVVKMTVEETHCYFGDTNAIPNAALTPSCFRTACGDGWIPSGGGFGPSEGDAPEPYDHGERELTRIDKLIKACRAPASSASRKR